MQQNIPNKQQMNPPPSSVQDNFRSKRQTFRKSIRKSVVNQKIKSLRKTLIIDANLYPTCQDESKKDKVFDVKISQLLKTLDLINSMQPECNYSSIKKFSQKLSYAIIGLSLIKQSMVYDDQERILEREMDGLSIEKIEQESEKKQSQGNFESIEDWKAIAWQPQTKSTKIQTLKQLWQITVLIKLEVFIQILKKFTQSCNYYSQIKDSQLIPINIIKWLYFQEQNMLKHVFTHQKTLRNHVNSTNTYDDQSIIYQQYIEISQRLVQFLSIEQINEVFFSPIYQSNLMKDFVNPSVRVQQQFELRQSYIYESPFSFLVNYSTESQNLLMIVKENLLAQIKKCEKWLTIERLKVTNIQECGNQWVRFMEKQEEELMRAKSNLSMFEKYLVTRNDMQQMHEQEEVEKVEFIEDTLSEGIENGEIII